MNREHLNEYRRQGLGMTSVDGEEADDMFVGGDLTVNHAPPERPPQPSGLSNWAKAAIAAGLLGTGVGAGVGVPLLLDALRQPATLSPPAQQAQEPQVHERRWGYRVESVDVIPPPAENSAQRD